MRMIFFKQTQGCGLAVLKCGSIFARCKRIPVSLLFACVGNSNKKTHMYITYEFPGYLKQYQLLFNKGLYYLITKS